MPNSIEFSSEETDSSEESFNDRKQNSQTYLTPDLKWNPCINNSSSPSEYRLHSMGIFGADANSPLSPIEHERGYANNVDHLTSRMNHLFTLEDENSLESMSSSGSNGAIKLDLEADCFLSEEDDDNDNDNDTNNDNNNDSDEISLEQEIFDSLRSKSVRNLNETAANELKGFRLEHVNENDESTDL